jgi:phosphatidate cytidylyltransferase
MILDKINRNILLRTISAIILAPTFVVSIIWLDKLYYLLLILVGILMFLEWKNMTKNTIYFKYGFIIILLPIACLLSLRLLNDYIITVLYFCSIWSVDTFAMVGGKTIGGPKLAHSISPNKTWSGLICGCISSGIVCYFLGKIFIINIPINLFVYGAINGVISQMSDIFISYFKRKCNVKDSGTLIPGHGGVLDRFDSTIFSAPFLLFLVNLF